MIPKLQYCALLLLCAMYSTKANSPLSKHVMKFGSGGDFRCSEDWDVFCGDSITTKHEIHNVTMCQWKACANQSEAIRRGQFCDGTFDCSDLSDECLCDDKILKTRQTYDICVKIYKDKVDEICTTINQSDLITLRRICDGNIDCGRKEDEKYCQYNCKRREIRYDVNYHECFRHGKLVKLNWRHLFDGERDCDDVSDEWHKHLPYCQQSYNFTYGCAFHQETSHCPGPLRKIGDKRFFSNPFKLYDSTMYYYLTWALGIFALFGNFMIVMHSIYILCCERCCRARRANEEGSFDTNDAIDNCGRRNTLNNINIVMVMSLCFSDMLTGMQVILMASTATVYSENFWKIYPNYLGSWMCITNSITGMVATEVSAFTIFVIATVRLYTVRCPFSASDKLRVKHVVMALCGVWILSLTIATIPVLHRFDTIEKSFTFSVALEPIANFEATIVERQALESMIRKIALLDKNLINGSRNDFTDCDALHNKRWSELEQFMSNNYGRGEWIYFGYYSQITACLPPIIVSVNEPGWIYSLGILLVDFSAYIFVMVAYVVVYKATAQTRDAARDTPERNVKHRRFSLRRPRHHSRTEQDQEMQKRIFILVATDFACWVPVCTFTFINLMLETVELKNQTLFIISIMMIQINSVINPVVYSRRARGVIKRAVGNLSAKLVSWLQKIAGRNEVINELDEADDAFPPADIEMKNQYTSVSNLHDDDEDVLATANL